MNLLYAILLVSVICKVLCQDTPLEPLAAAEPTQASSTGVEPIQAEINEQSAGTWRDNLWIPAAGDFLAHSHPLNQPYTQEAGVCQSVNILNISDFKLLENCKVVEGFIHIVNVTITNEEYESLTFPQLTEINDYFIMLQTQGIKSIGKIFPNLAVIRGYNQLMKGYSLVVVENLDLEEIGLNKLLHIGRGAVRINANLMLCHADTIDWSLIAPYSSQSFHYILNNKKITECPTCSENCNSAENSKYSVYNDGRKLCWNLSYCQYICPASCGVAGCNEDGQCCDSNCLGGCTKIDSNFACVACKNVKYNEVCTSNCTKIAMGNITLNHRRCIDRNECYSTPRPLSIIHQHVPVPYSLTPYFPFDGQCTTKCPGNLYMRHENGKHCHGDKSVYKNCPGGEIHSADDLRVFRGCTNIEGSILIFIDSGVSIPLNSFDSNLNSIQEITGYLSIIGLPPKIRSLTFFKSLRTIHGDELYKEKYALLIIYNNDLETLFLKPGIFEIKRGSMFISMNLSLCNSKVLRFQHQVSEISGSCCDTVVMGNDEEC